MIDLSYKPRNNEKREEPLGIVIWGVMPFVLMIVWGVAHAL